MDTEITTAAADQPYTSERNSGSSVQYAATRTQIQITDNWQGIYSYRLAVLADYRYRQTRRNDSASSCFDSMIRISSAGAPQIPTDVAREVPSLRQPRDNDVTKDRAAIHIDSKYCQTVGTVRLVGLVRSCMP